MNQEVPGAEDPSSRAFPRDAADPLTSAAIGDSPITGDFPAAEEFQSDVAPQPVAKWYQRPWAWGRRKRSRRQWIALIGVFGVVVVGLGWWAFRQNGTEEMAESLPSPPSERFAEIVKALASSAETEVRIDDFKLDDAMLKQLVAIDRLTILQVDCEEVSTEALSRLAKMPKLEQLHLRGIKIDDERLAILSSSETIWLLNLPDADITPESIQKLDTMPALRNLRLGIEGGDNRHGRAVSTLTRLRAVHLIGVGVTDEGLQALARMPLLESLYLDGAAVTELGWSWLFQNNPQLHVHINQKHHDNDPQKH
jgi:hypothetical protein